jgi:DNA-binding IclR family transcriptional regulator
MTDTVARVAHTEDAAGIGEPVGGEQLVGDSGWSAGLGGSGAIEKALTLLGALGTGRTAEPLSGLASRTSMPKSTVCRILKTMETQGFVARKGQLYCLGPRMGELGRQAEVSAHNDLRTISLGVLERLFVDVRTTVHLAALNGSEILVLEKITAPGAGRIPTRVGSTVPAACTAVGKAHLAYADPRTLEAAMRGIVPAPTARSSRCMADLLTRLAEVRRSGIAVDQEEFRPGITCVAAPVLLRGQPIAAISASRVHGGLRSTSDAEHVSSAAARLSGLLQRSTAFVE